MDDDQLIRAIASFVIVGLLLPSALWYSAIRFGKPRLKAFSVIIGVAYISLFAYNGVREWTDWFPLVYTTYVNGPGLVDFTYYVNVAGSRHQMSLTPIPKFGEKSTAPVALSFEVRTPTDQVVAKGRETLNWTPLKAEFTSPEEGIHKLILEIPQPVRKVRVDITERKK
jgi:hypothetical protein